MFLKISEKYIKLFLSILYLTEMETLTYNIKDIIMVNYDSMIIVFLYGHRWLQSVVF